MHSDDTLIDRVRSGDREAFGEIVRQHQAALRGFASRYVVSGEDALDLVQDTFVEAFRHLDRFESGRDMRPWLYGICRNLICNHLRAATRWRNASQGLVDTALAGHLQDRQPGTDDADQRIDALRLCLGSMSAEHRGLLQRRYADGERVKDLAARMERSEGAVSMLLLRLRESLQQCIAGRVGASS